MLLVELDCCKWVKPEEDSDLRTPDDALLPEEPGVKQAPGPLAPPLPVEDDAVDVAATIDTALLLLLL